MTIEAKGYWADWEPNPEYVGRDEGEVYVHVFLPYSDLQWASHQKTQLDFEAIKKQETPPGLLNSDPDYYFKDINGNLMPGNITGDVYWAIHHLLPFERLTYIKQLALLTYSAEGERNYYGKGPGFHQTRSNHSFLTALPLERILIKNHFPQETVNNGIICAMIHDIATPPFGDPTKEIDPEVLSEEAAIKRLLKKYDLTKLDQYGFDEETVLDAIQGQGTLGKLLDIADKLSYTAVDIYNYIGPTSDTIDPTRRRDLGAINTTIDPMKDLVYLNQEWANIYHEVKVDKDGTPYFEDPHNLSTFLELRARMHKGLYLNPHCRGQDMLYKMLIKPLYSRNPDTNFPFNSENLLCLTDEEANLVIVKSWTFLDEERALHFSLGVLPDYVKVKDPTQIDQTIKNLQTRGALVIGSETIRKFNPATNFRTIDPTDGKIKPFAEVLPEKAQKLEDIVNYCNQTVVYYWPEETDPQSQEVKLKPTIEQIIEDAKRRNNGKLPSYSLYD